MLNQLIESKNHAAENARKNGFLATTLGVLVAVLLSGWTYSLFAKSFGMGTSDFDLSSIVVPVAPSEEPPAPKPEPQQPERRQTVSNDERPTVIERIARIEDSLNKPPKIEESRALKSSPLRPDEARLYTEGTENRYRTSDADRDSDGNGGGLKSTNTSKAEEEDVKTPEVVKPTPKPTPDKPISRPPQSGGVLNGKATRLVTPAYPAAARAMGIKDTVQVQVLIDEQGNVVSATAASGHPLLRAVAVQAARQSKFSTTYLSNQPIKVTGVIIYKFQ